MWRYIPSGAVKAKPKPKPKPFDVESAGKFSAKSWPRKKTRVDGRHPARSMEVPTSQSLVCLKHVGRDILKGASRANALPQDRPSRRRG